MRQLLSLAVIAVSVAFAACRPSVAGADKPQPTGELHVLLPSLPSSLNPNLRLDEMSIVVGRSIFSQLLTINETGRLLPELAESWTVSPDGLTYTFRLRRGVRWHDGTRFSSADVRWTLDAISRDGFAGREALAPVREVSAPDDDTVVLTLRHPWAPFAADLAGPGLSILPRHVFEGSDWRAHPGNDRPIGTGPFKFVRRVGDTLVLEANTDYFRSGPYVQRIAFRAVPSSAVTELLMRSEADYSVLRPVSLDLLAPPEHLVVHTLPTSARYYVAMNLRRKPFDDVRVREAVARAVVRQEILAKALGGLGAPAVGWYTPDVAWAYNTGARVPEFDLSAAGRLLDDAGLRVRGGRRFSAQLVAPDSPPLREVGMVVAAQLRRAGIDVVVDRVPIGEWPRRTMGEHDFDLTVVAGTQGPDPDQLRRRYLASTESGAYIGYDDSEFRDAVERGARAVDMVERAAAYHRAQEILARDLPFVPLVEGVKVVVHHRRVSGLPQLEARGLVGSFDFSLVKLAAPPAGVR